MKTDTTLPLDVCTEFKWEPTFQSTNTVDLSELAQAASMSLAEVRELMEYGALCPLASMLTEPVFPVACMAPLRLAGQLRRDYDLDLFVVVIVMDYLSRIDHLESQVRALQATSLQSIG
jgi:hypothetical protein